MILNLLTGNTFEAVNNGIVKNIITNGVKTARHIVIVPDQFTLTSEKELLEKLNLASSFNLEVMSFSRLALKSLGKKVNNMLGQQASVMLLKKIILENADALSCYNKVARKKGYANELYAVITNLRNSGISVEKLKKLLPQLDGVLLRKTKDLIILYESYIKELDENYSDIGSRLEALKDNIKNLDWIGTAHFYITDFHNISQVKLNIVEELAKNALSLTLGVVDSPNNANYKIFPRYLIDFALNISQKIGIVLNRQSEIQTLDAEQFILSDRLFGYRLNTDIKGGFKYKVKAFPTIRKEITGASEKIRELVIEKGYRYKDFNVVCNNAQELKNDFRRIFGAYDIPFYLDVKTSLISTPIAGILIKAINCINKNFSQEAVLEFIKEAFFPCNYADKNTFENYVLKYNVSGNYFLKPFVQGADEINYVTAENTRIIFSEFISILIPENTTDVIATVGKIRNFYKYLLDKGIVENFINEQENNGLDLEADITRQSVNKIHTTLEQVEAILGSRILEFSDTLDIVIATLESVNISNVPQYIDSVFIGNIEESKYNNCKVMFILGANDGAYPTIAKDKCIINNGDTEVWADYGVRICPDFSEKILLDKFYIMQLLLKAKDCCYISYNAEAGEPSLMVSQLMRILNIPEAIKPKEPVLMTEYDYAVKIGTEFNAANELMTYYGERISGISDKNESIFDYLYMKLKGNANYRFLTQFNKEDNLTVKIKTWKEYENKTFTSVSALEKYFHCPFEFFVQYGLKAKKRPDGEPDYKDIGDFLHKILELFFGNPNFVNDVNIDIASVVTELSYNLLDNDFNYLTYTMDMTAIKKTIIDRCVYTVKKLAENQRRSEAEIIATEFGFGLKNSAVPPIELKMKDKTYYIRGVIDRIDRYGDYIVIIDYKTKSDIDYGFKEIYYGERAQLLLYLNAYRKYCNCRPLGLFYLPLPYKYNNEDKKGVMQYKYVGLMAGLEDGIKHFDKCYDGSDSFLPVKGKINKKSGLFELSYDKMIGEKDFDVLAEYTDSLLKVALSEIEEGYIKAAPLDGCGYCEYGNICGKRGNDDVLRKKTKVILEQDNG